MLLNITKGILLFLKAGIFDPSIVFYILIAALAAFIITVPLMFIYIYAPQLYERAFSTVSRLYHEIMNNRYLSYKSLIKKIKKAGYLYDELQDVFISVMDAWQRKYGYCRLYDEAAAPLGMIVDSEPIYFEYGDKKWLIEFWKGQYDMACGAEVGIYTSKGPELNIPGVFNGTFYQAASDEDCLPIYFSLKRNGNELFERDDTHWWLTGFKLGYFAEPQELSMLISITLKDRNMRNAFWIALNDAGYTDDEIYIRKNTISLIFDKPKSKQPLTRNKDTDWVIQRKNEQLCQSYQEITKDCVTMPEKLLAVQKRAPDMLKEILNIGKNKPLYQVFKQIKKWI